MNENLFAVGEFAAGGGIEKERMIFTPFPLQHGSKKMGS
jgi:hypothetical protein